MYKCLNIWNPQNPFRPAANLFGRRSFCVLGTEVSKCWKGFEIRGKTQPDLEGSCDVTCFLPQRIAVIFTLYSMPLKTSFHHLRVSATKKNKNISNIPTSCFLSEASVKSLHRNLLPCCTRVHTVKLHGSKPGWVSRAVAISPPAVEHKVPLWSTRATRLGVTLDLKRLVKVV